MSVQSTRAIQVVVPRTLFGKKRLKLFILQRIFDVTARFIEDIRCSRHGLSAAVCGSGKDMKRQRREVEQARKRIIELDRIFKRIYEDDINGTISHERFLKLSAEYEAEQKELIEFTR